MDSIQEPSIVDAPSTRDRLYRWMARSMASNLGRLLLRLWLGSMLLMHGSAKVYGDMQKFTTGVENLGFPLAGAFAWAAALSEFAGGALIILGLLTRPASVFTAITMAVAAFAALADDPFNVKELALTYLALSVAIFLLGPGRISLDQVLFKRGGERV